jgi:hypothetical protein
MERSATGTYYGITKKILLLHPETELLCGNKRRAYD